MKIVVFTALSLLSASVLAADAGKLKTEKQKTSYALGRQVGEDVKRNNVDLDPDVFTQAIRESLKGQKSKMTDEEIKTTLQGFQQKMREKQVAMVKELGEKNKKAGEAYLEANKKKPDVKTTASGLQYRVIKEGKGKKPGPDDVVVAHYVGTHVDGKEFDSSVKRGEPATFAVSGVIKGWQEALQMMPEGSKWEIVVPAALGYGERGAGGAIGPNETLVFNVELLEVKPGEKAESNKN